MSLSEAVQNFERAIVKFTKETGNPVGELWGWFIASFINTGLLQNVEIEWERSTQHCRGPIDLGRSSIGGAEGSITRFGLIWCATPKTGEYVMTPHQREFEFDASQYTPSVEGENIIFTRSPRDFFVIHTSGEKLDISLIK